MYDLSSYRLHDIGIKRGKTISGLRKVV